ncbi:MAG: hypothetical protein LC623_03885, partial [Halobacteriales archaeon]|nr:hypothetical protein [Halobacteriales archaeon]
MTPPFGKARKGAKEEPADGAAHLSPIPPSRPPAPGAGKPVRGINPLASGLAKKLTPRSIAGPAASPAPPAHAEAPAARPHAPLAPKDLSV